VVDLLVLCTGNICRSPMAAGLLRHRLAARGVEADVSSAGLLLEQRPASDHGVDEMLRRSIDLRDHRSQVMTAELVAGADLVLGMAREHVREAVVLVREAWPRAFTLKELVRRGEAVGSRRAGEDLSGWLGRCHAGRTTRDLLGAAAHDDVADPIGGSAADYARTAAELEDLVARLVALAWPED
jgi:protein-tyrosine phosphatase